MDLGALAHTIGRLIWFGVIQIVLTPLLQCSGKPYLYGHLEASHSQANGMSQVKLWHCATAAAAVMPFALSGMITRDRDIVGLLGYWNQTKIWRQLLSGKTMLWSDLQQRHMKCDLGHLGKILEAHFIHFLLMLDTHLMLDRNQVWLAMDLTDWHLQAAALRFDPSMSMRRILWWNGHKVPKIWISMWTKITWNILESPVLKTK